MSKNITSLVIILVIIIVIFSGIFLLANNKGGNTADINLTPNFTANPTIVPTQASAIITPTTQETPEATSSSTTTMPDGLQIQDITVGNGQEVKSGDEVIVNYIGTFQNGQKFDSSYDRNTPLDIQIGVGRVIKGWDEGVVGMKVGGKRKLIVPPELGYGSQDYNGIPGNSTLIFEIELISVK